jgi:hypothetical protein
LIKENFRKKPEKTFSLGKNIPFSKFSKNLKKTPKNEG